MIKTNPASKTERILFYHSTHPPILKGYTESRFLSRHSCLGFWVLGLKYCLFLSRPHSSLWLLLIPLVPKAYEQKYFIFVKNYYFIPILEFSLVHDQAKTLCFQSRKRVMEYFYLIFLICSGRLGMLRISLIFFHAPIRFTSSIVSIRDCMSVLVKVKSNKPIFIWSWTVSTHFILVNGMYQ